MRLGLIGGLGWPATAAYYTALCKGAAERFPGGSPEMVIDSLDMAQTMAARGAFGDDASWAGFDAFFHDAMTRLEAAGADVVAIASVTPHLRLDAIRAKTTLPILSALDATAEAVRTSGASQALVVGTAVTMGSGLFEAPLRALGVDPGARLTSDEIASFTALLDTYFYIGRGAEGRAALEGWLAPWLKKRPGAVVVLACTDLAIGFPEAEGRAIFEAGGVTYVDAMAAHVDAILSKLGARKS